MITDTASIQAWKKVNYMGHIFSFWKMVVTQSKLHEGNKRKVPCKKKEIIQKESVKYKYYATFICGLELFLVFTSSVWLLWSSSDEVTVLEAEHVNIGFTYV
jgi:hypothetical protein